ncbi:Aquaporin-9 isoform 2 [Schistosoma japonicum]|uniref:Aquaporin-9 isoform 2 n=1 Tax=Schistosoma japonicum TaxID=6182 RepID=A0A4Z2D405_SCHJA|nr:Aquaporin-9 isoform 2 [Schistosoma japonicum]
MPNNESVYQIRYNAFIKQLTNHFDLTKWPFLCNCLSEFFGTTIFILFGSGVMIQSGVSSIKNRTIEQFISISSGWGIAKIIGLLISDINDHSGLMDPTITLIYCLIGKLPLRYLMPFSIIQLAGSILGSSIIICAYWENIQIYAKHSSTEKLDMNFIGALLLTMPNVSHQLCLVDYILSNTLYTCVILIIRDKNIYNIPNELQLIYIGLLVTGIIGSLSLNIGIAINPARDLGVRIVLSLFGWGIQAFKANNYYFWLPLIGPYIGAIIGLLIYELIICLYSPLPKMNYPKSPDDEYLTENYLQSSLVEEMTGDLFDITEVEDCFTDTEDTLY